MIAVDSLERFLDRAMLDLWKNYSTGHIIISTPRKYPSGDGSVSLDTDFQYRGSMHDKYRDHTNFDHSEKDKANEVVPGYLNMLASRGFFVQQQNGSHKAVLLHTRFDGEDLAAILNSKGTVVSAADVRSKEFGSSVDGGHYTHSTRHLFRIGRSKHLTDEQILERIKAYNWVPAQ